MARKRKRDGIDWDAVADNFGGLKKIIHDSSSKKLIDDGVAKEFKDKIGLDGLLAILSPEERRELARRIESANP